MHVITQADWSMPELGDHDERELDVITEANIHHDALKRPRLHTDCADRVRAIDKEHRESNGWAGIGYSRVICPHGYVFKCRPRRVVPAAAFGHNTPILAYCLMADENEFANPAQFQALVDMVRRDEEALGRKLKWTTHKEVCPPGYTECPGMGIQSQVIQYRKKDSNKKKK